MIFSTSFSDGRYVCMDRTGKGAPEFVKWLSAAMCARELGIRQLEEYAGVSRSSISAILKGKGRPGFGTIQKLAAFFRVDTKLLLALLPGTAYSSDIPSSSLIGEITGVVLVPVLEQEAGAGEGRQLLDYEFVSPTITAGHNVIAIRIHGDCMAPRIEDGDTVIVDREKPWVDGRVVLAQVDDGLMIKRAYRIADFIVLRPDNPRFQEVKTMEGQILGVVIRVIKSV